MNCCFGTKKKKSGQRIPTEDFSLRNFPASVKKLSTLETKIFDLQEAIPLCKYILLLKNNGEVRYTTLSFLSPYFSCYLRFLIIVLICFVDAIRICIRAKVLFRRYEQTKGHCNYVGKALRIYHCCR